MNATPNAAAGRSHAFASLGLHDALLRAVAELGFTEPTPVQQAAIPAALARPGAGADLMVSSRTGSGKTAAYLLPVLDALIPLLSATDHPARGGRTGAARGRFAPAAPLALVLCPTRELAQQVARDAIDLARYVRGLRIATVVGGMPYGLQLQRLQGAQLVVATPGRLLDLQRSGHVRLDAVRHAVLDEADRMLDLGFAEDLADIHALTVARQQTLMFSATFAPRVQALAERIMRTPQRMALQTAQDAHTHIEQRLYWCDSPAHKRQLLDHWLRDEGIEQAIVFASTQIECDELAQDLQQAGFAAVALHGALSQGLRNRRLQALRQGQVQILVATDVAARGIDVPTITHVFNYGLPMKAEDYVHRIGRTGRAGRRGLAVTMAEARDRRRIGAIEAMSRQPIPAATIEGLEPKRVFVGDDRARRGAPGARRGEGWRPRGPAGASRREGSVRREGGWRTEGAARSPRPSHEGGVGYAPARRGGERPRAAR
ncbi:DEAD/DEAH box helicase [Tepidimonas charontis]|uniref:ATP-dependent RNA helicase RhlE n=1 Tax=Tepidimonas charontis TaxID=2267262 RepID=A0A554XCU4_9BURK|nr:DEAD/DEAH box helicase [Tepidimonas charontis]TSE33646.1 ATP-dependent RNA helicase RhlE [Tepidimonas charontis]